MNVKSVAAVDSFIGPIREAIAPLTVVIIIWGVIALGFFVWYLWAMSRLFPRIGLPAGQGWIPLWNEWKLIDRVGLPGWTVVLALVGLGIVPVIFRTMAQHRIGREAGVDGGYTVLGVILAPLWATLLASLLHGQVLGSSRVAAWPASGGAQQFGSAQQFQPGGVQPLAGAMGAPVASAPAPASGFAVAQAGGFNPYAAPAFQTTASGHPAPQPTAQAAPWASLVAPAIPFAADSPFAPAAAASAASIPASPIAPTPQPFMPMSIGGPTPFTQETEAEYARLANESFMAPPAAPLGQAVASEPFSWTAASQSVEPDPAPRIPAPPVHPVAAAPRFIASPLSIPLAPSLSPSPSMPAPLPPSLANPLAPSLPPGDATQTVGVEQGAATPIAGASAPSGITANYEPLAPAPSMHDPLDDELDRTVVVQRVAPITWYLVLPDGQQLPLSADTIVGRRPPAEHGATALQIPDPTRTLSKTHARLRLVDEQWTVEDLGSTNGVYLFTEDGSEQEVRPGQAVATGPRFMLGTLDVRLRRSDEVE